LSNNDEKDKRAFILEVDNINDVEMLENLAVDPILNNSR